MAAFEPILSGIPGLDACLDSIRLGDNVVWQVSKLDEFRVFARAFAEQAVRDGRNILYVRFAGHEPILPEMPGVRVVRVPLSHLFESFTVDVHKLIECEGRDAFYVFDCLSELEEAWATDLMMGNFFRLTCPYLFTLDTVAYFPVIRGRHSFEAIEKIVNTTQLFLDVFPGKERERGIREDVLFVSCDGLVGNRALMRDMDEILSLLQKEYAYPVDIEYTINCSSSGEYMISLLQCRPLQLTRAGDRVTIPEDIPDEDVLIDTRRVSMGFSRSFPIDLLVYIDPVAYYRMPYRDKHRVKQVLSAVNWKLRGQGKRMLLLTPGRICTSSPELGVPTDFSDISEFDTILKLAESRAGYMPELSYGSHIFQDLVEAEILYSAVFEGESTRAFREDFFREGNDLARFTESVEGLENVVYIHDYDRPALLEYYDISSERFVVIRKAERP